MTPSNTTLKEPAPMLVIRGTDAQIYAEVARQCGLTLPEFLERSMLLLHLVHQEEHKGNRFVIQNAKGKTIKTMRAFGKDVGK